MGAFEDLSEWLRFAVRVEHSMAGLRLVLAMAFAEIAHDPGRLAALHARIVDTVHGLEFPGAAEDARAEIVATILRTVEAAMPETPPEPRVISGH